MLKINLILIIAPSGMDNPWMKMLRGADLCGGLRSLHRSLPGFSQLAVRGTGAFYWAGRCGGRDLQIEGRD